MNRDSSDRERFLPFRKADCRCHPNAGVLNVSEHWQSSKHPGVGDQGIQPYGNGKKSFHGPDNRDLCYSF